MAENLLWFLILAAWPAVVGFTLYRWLCRDIQKATVKALNGK